MPAPFREPADSPTAIALARLESMRTDPARSLLARCVWYRETPRANADPALVRSAEALGFRLLGCAAEGTLPKTFRKRVFVDAPRTTQAHLMAGHYFLVTYFESGKCIITWDHVSPTQSTDDLTSRSTDGSFERDYASHSRAVALRSATESAIVVPDLRTAVALGRHYYRQVTSFGTALANLSMFLLLFAFFVFVAWMIFRRQLATPG